MSFTFVHGRLTRPKIDLGDDGTILSIGVIEGLFEVVFGRLNLLFIGK